VTVAADAAEANAAAIVIAAAIAMSLCVMSTPHYTDTVARLPERLTLFRSPNR
jgi:hypothetical protein